MHALHDVLRVFDSTFGHLKLFNFFFFDTSHFTNLLGLEFGLGLGLELGLGLGLGFGLGNNFKNGFR